MSECFKINLDVSTILICNFCRCILYEDKTCIIMIQKKLSLDIYFKQILLLKNKSIRLRRQQMSILTDRVSNVFALQQNQKCQ